MKLDMIEPTSELLYLARTVTYNNSNWVDLYQNPKKSRRQLLMVEKLLTKAGFAVWLRVMICKAVVHTLLLYGSEICLVTGAVLIVI